LDDFRLAVGIDEAAQYRARRHLLDICQFRGLHPENQLSVSRSGGNLHPFLLKGTIGNPSCQACARLQGTLNAQLCQLGGDGGDQSYTFFVFACFPWDKQTDRHGVSFSYLFVLFIEKRGARIHQEQLDFCSANEKKRVISDNLSIRRAASRGFAYFSAGFRHIRYHSVPVAISRRASSATPAA